MIAALIAIPTGGIVLILELIAWRPADPAAGGTALRELGETTRPVDEARMAALTFARYALGALAYLMIIAIGISRLRRGHDRRPARAWRAVREALGRRHGLSTVLLGLAIVVGVRLLLSAGGAAAMAPLASTGAFAYLAPLNAVHAVGKIVTAPFLATLLVAGSAAGTRSHQIHSRATAP